MAYEAFITLKLQQRARLSKRQVTLYINFLKRTNYAPDARLTIGTGKICLLVRDKRGLVVPQRPIEIVTADAADYHVIKLFNWRKNNSPSSGKEHWYVYTSGFREDGKWTTKLYLHRLLLQPKGKRQMVDHKLGDGQGLNNCRDNLRPATPKQNGQNRTAQKASSPYRGVYRAPNGRDWNAKVTEEGRPYAIGSFSSELEAAKGADWGQRLLAGDFARLNLPELEGTGFHAKRLHAGFHQLKALEVMRTAA